MEQLEGDYFIKNRQLLPASAFDPHFMRAGASVYEVVRIIDGVSLFMEDHLERFRQSAAIIDRPLLVSAEDILQRMQTLIELVPAAEGNMKLVVQYDNGAGGGAPVFYAFYIKHHYPPANLYRQGVDTIIYPAVRSHPNAKVADLALRDRINREIEQQHVFEAILLDREGYITEGSRSNLFMIKDSAIFTAPLRHVLPGVTRGRIVEIIHRQHYPLAEKQLTPADLAAMDAVFLTGTSPKVMPVRRVGDMFFTSATDPLLLDIMHRYDRLVADYVAAYPAH